MQTFNRIDLTKTLSEGSATLQCDLSQGQIDLLMDYLALLIKWNAVYNLTAVRDPAQMVIQHVLDSLAAVAAFDGLKNVLDVGSGGGLPGMILAIALPDLQVAMIDTVHKKTAFLTQAKVELGLSNVTIHTARVEQLQVTHKFDAITSRAFADLTDFINWSEHLLAPGGRFIAMKGINPQQELSRLPVGWVAREVRALAVPNLQAQRHLVFIERSTD
ncbi:MAG: 16S rRNA (guanine(527)-N(7))-methyltransferase RsmG [Burkholderiaceae bacterium]